MSSLKFDVWKGDCLELMSVAIPKLGCGLGGLDWNDVKPLIEEVFGDVAFDVYIYE